MNSNAARMAENQLEMESVYHALAQNKLILSLVEFWSCAFSSGTVPWPEQLLDCLDKDVNNCGQWETFLVVIIDWSIMKDNNYGTIKGQ